MLELAELSVREVLTAYNGVSMYIGLYCAALLYVLIKGTPKEKAIFLYPSLFLLLTVFNPIIAPALSSFFGELSTYYRFLWALPVVILLGHTATKLIISQNKKIKQLAVIAACLLIVVVCGQFIFKNTALVPAENIMKVSDDLINVVEIIKQNQQEDPNLSDENIKAIVPFPFALEIRSYDPSIYLAYGRNDYLQEITGRVPDEQETENIATLLQVFEYAQPIPTKDLQHILIEEEVDYMVFTSALNIQELVESTGAELLATSNEYLVYKFTAQ